MKYFITQYWKILIGLVAIFIGGLGFGGVLESLRHRNDPQPIQNRSQPNTDWIELTLASLEESLALTESQKQQIRPQIEATAREIQLTRESALIKFELSLLELHRAIAPKLEAEQKTKLLKNEQALGKRIKQRSDSLLEAEE